MPLPKDPKQWARDQAQRLRDDPRGWARDQADRARELVDVAPFSDEVLERELSELRAQVARLASLSADERVVLHDQLVALHERLGTGGAMVSGAKIGFAAAVLPVIGMVTGPLLGGAYGAYRSQRLHRARDEVQGLLRQVVRGP